MTTIYETLSDESKSLLELTPDEQKAYNRYIKEKEFGKRVKKKKNKSAKKARKKNRRKK